MKTITVFIASSEELKADRNSFQALVASLDDVLEPRGIRVKCRRWEDFDAYCTGTRTQDEYNKTVRSSDICICMFHRLAGEFTVEEFNQALDEYKSNHNHPKTYVYMRALADGEIETEALKEFKENLFKSIGHYWCNYSNEDTMKLHFVMQLERLMPNAQASLNGDTDIKVDNGIVTIHGRRIADYRNLPFAAANAEYMSLKDRYAHLDKDIVQLRALGIDESHDMLKEKIAERAKCRDDIDSMEKQLLDMAKFVNQSISGGRQMSERKRLAIEMFEHGNIKGVIDVLNEDDMALEAQQAEQQIRRGRELEKYSQTLIDRGMDVLRSQIDEYIMRAQALMLNTDCTDRFALACKAYESAVSIAAGNMEKEEQAGVLQTYATFLLVNNQYGKAEKIYRQCLDIYDAVENPSAESKGEKAAVLVNLANLYSRTQRSSECEAMYRSALKIYAHLAKDNLDDFGQIVGGVVIVMMNLAALYCEDRKYAESETLLRDALEYCRFVANIDGKAEMALVQMKLANLYPNALQYEEAEALYKDSLATLRSLAAEYPGNFDQWLADVLNSFANFCQRMERYAESEAMYIESLEIRQRMAKENPMAFELELAQTQRNLAVLYEHTNRFDEGEALCMEALKIYRHWADEAPKAFEPDLINALASLIIIYRDTDRLVDSEPVLKEVSEILSRQLDINYAKYGPLLADVQVILASIYHKTKRTAEREAAYKEALDIYQHLANENPMEYDPKLADVLAGLLDIYDDTQRHAERESALTALLEVYKRLVKDNPEEYAPLLAATGSCLVEVYYGSQRYAEMEAMYKALLDVYQPLAARCPDIIREGYVQALTNVAFASIVTGHPEAAERYARQAAGIDPADHLPYTNIAEALLVQGRYAEAEELFVRYKDELKDSFLSDFDILAETGAMPESHKCEVEKIKRLLSE